MLMCELYRGLVERVYAGLYGFNLCVHVLTTLCHICLEMAVDFIAPRKLLLHIFEQFMQQNVCLAHLCLDPR